MQLDTSTITDGSSDPDEECVLGTPLLTMKLHLSYYYFRFAMYAY